MSWFKPDKKKEKKDHPKNEHQKKEEQEVKKPKVDPAPKPLGEDEVMINDENLDGIDLCGEKCEHPDGYVSVCCKPKRHTGSHGDDMDYWKDGDILVSVTKYPKEIENELVRQTQEEGEEGREARTSAEEGSSEEERGTGNEKT